MLDAFIGDMLPLLAGLYDVEEAVVRVLVQEYPKAHWGIGRAAAAARS